MSATPNLFDPEFDGVQEGTALGHRRAQLGRQAGARRLGASLLELAPGQAAFPMHWHAANEELAFVIAGRPTLRTPDGERVLEQGEVVSFPIGETGAHQIVNRGEEPVRFLIVSEMNAPDIVFRPESGSLSAFGRAPGTPPDSGFHAIFLERDGKDMQELWKVEPEPPPPPHEDTDR